MEQCFACSSEKITTEWLKDKLELGNEFVLFVTIPIVTCEGCCSVYISPEGMRIRSEAIFWYYRQRGIPEEILEEASLVWNNRATIPMRP